MADFLTRDQRSERMSRIPSRDTQPELNIRRELHRLGLRYGLNSRLPGKPDLVLRRHKSVIFVHGCFWHRHEGCNIATTPKSNTEFWQQKFDRNVERDGRVQAELREAGWQVLVVWECEVRSATRARVAAGKLNALLRRNSGET